MNKEILFFILLQQLLYLLFTDALLWEPGSQVEKIPEYREYMRRHNRCMHAPFPVTYVGTKSEELPEYSEFMHKSNESLLKEPSLALPNSLSLTSAPSNFSMEETIAAAALVNGTGKFGEMKAVETIIAPFPFPAIYLCKETPDKDNHFGHIFCWGMDALFFILIAILVIYLFCLILKILDKLEQRKNRTKKLSQDLEGGLYELLPSLSPDGPIANRENSEKQSEDQSNIHGLFSMRPST